MNKKQKKNKTYNALKTHTSEKTKEKKEIKCVYTKENNYCGCGRRNEDKDSYGCSRFPACSDEELSFLFGN